ncbi:twin-arginine translocase subunit TatC [Halomicrobium salinisoli]|uniref:twin-arginine translocase subunit TatC n=1 Tax=Halomicrobium salinisoli TaxID=2878391 RepID=UPI001CF06DE2|nr:twin-arginine translocase subunit TatC [Halomicrobium salinisoli]
MAAGLDEDTVRTLQSGRDTLGSMLGAAQSHLQKVFLVWVFALLATIMALQSFLWDQLRDDLLYEKMGPELSEAAEIIAVTPFDVILLQFKIGAVVGIIVALPLLIWYSRDALRERGKWPNEKLPTWQVAAMVTISLSLFAGGILYAYDLFFPLMFEFLAGNARQADFQPHYSIVKWVGFVALLALSFGLAAQLPLVMSALSYSGIVPYETFRDNWKWAVVIIFAFGALFSPPDPFTQVMWATPLVGLYAVSLGISKLLVLTKRAGEVVDATDVARARWNKLAAAAVLAGGVTYYVVASELFGYIREAVAFVSTSRSVEDVARPAWFGLSSTETTALIAAVVALAAALFVLYYYMVKELDVAAAEAGNFGDPTAIDLGELSAGAVRSAPREAFEELSEAEALQLADDAMSEDDPEKAELILDRWDTANEDDGEAAAEGDAEEEEDAGVLTSTTAGVVDSFTEEETTEEDIGGYYYDIAFILDSLTSKAIWLVGTFMLVAGSAFVFLYQGGIGRIKRIFVANLPATMQADVQFITLHPVEHLVFIVKFSTILGIVSALPLLVYFAWPALLERGWVKGDRGVLGIWGFTVIATLIGGTVGGFIYIAPAIISWLAFDVLNSGMIISYRVAKFGWLVLFLTVGIGLLVEIPITMLLFHRGGIVTFQTIQERWRTVTLGVFAASALFSPKGIFTMFLIAVPVTLFFLVGLGLLWLYTFGGRREPEPEREPAD